MPLQREINCRETQQFRFELNGGGKINKKMKIDIHNYKISNKVNKRFFLL
jgi:hypothetical protein